MKEVANVYHGDHGVTERITLFPNGRQGDQTLRNTRPDAIGMRIPQSSVGLPFLRVSVFSVVKILLPLSSYTKKT